MRLAPVPVTVVLSSGHGSMEVLGRELAARLPASVTRFDTGGHLPDAEAFRLTPVQAARRAVHEIGLVRALRQRDGLIHFPNHHHARYGLGVGRRYVVTVHDLVRHLDHQRPAPLIHRPTRVDRGMLRLDLGGIARAAAVIAVSDFTRRELVQHLDLDPAKVRVIHPGIDRRRFRPVGAAALPHPYILFVGSEQPRKNLAALLQAISLLKRGREHRRLKLIKVGEAGGTEAPFRERTSAAITYLGLEGEVDLVGRVDHRRLVELLSNAACLVQPSLHEGFGLPPLEAMACGCPVIVSDRGALPEISGPAAIVTDPAPEALAGQIERLLGDAGLRERLRRRGLRHVARFDWARTAASTLDLYRSAGAGRRVPRPAARPQDPAEVTAQPTTAPAPPGPLPPDPGVEGNPGRALPCG